MRRLCAQKCRSRPFRGIDRKILISKNVSSIWRCDGWQNLEPLGLIRKILRNKHLARGP